MRSCSENAIKKMVICKAHCEMNKKMLLKNQEKPVRKGANQKYPQYTAPEWSIIGKCK
jgi:hypothetical protein